MEGDKHLFLFLIDFQDGKNHSATPKHLGIVVPKAESKVELEKLGPLCKLTLQIPGCQEAKPEDFTWQSPLPALIQAAD